MSSNSEKLHLLTSKFIQLVVMPPTNTLDREMYGLTEHGQIWVFDEGTSKWHLLDAERILPK